MNLTWPIVVAFVTCMSVAHATDFKCPEPTMQIAKEAKKIVDAGDADLKGTVQNTIVNLWAAYPQAERLAIVQNLQSTSCYLLKNSSFSDDQKLDRWTKILELFSSYLSPDPCAGEDNQWSLAESIHSLQAYEHYLKLYPKCMMGGLAKTCIGQIKSGAELFQCADKTVVDLKDAYSYPCIGHGYFKTR